MEDENGILILGCEGLIGASSSQAKNFTVFVPHHLAPGLERLPYLPYLVLIIIFLGPDYYAPTRCSRWIYSAYATSLAPHELILTHAEPQPRHGHARTIALVQRTMKELYTDTRFRSPRGSIIIMKIYKEFVTSRESAIRKGRCDGRRNFDSNRSDRLVPNAATGCVQMGCGVMSGTRRLRGKEKKRGRGEPWPCASSIDFGPSVSLTLVSTRFWISACSSAVWHTGWFVTLVRPVLVEHGRDG